ncbi:MAG: hypothetical protein H7331_01705 [Bacteroidia bacterium]|nr:hypothetical protein [Bacteroidia bacterium]
MKQLLFIVYFALNLTLIQAQVTTPTSTTATETKREYYFSWGYNKEWYTPSTIHVVQPSLGNDFKLIKAQGHDRIGWDKLLKRPLTVPQYNYRLGFFFKKNTSLGFEINFDHTKYITTRGQMVRWQGTINGQQVSYDSVTTRQNFDYNLNNGANFFCFNIVKRFKNYEAPHKQWFVLHTLLKAGAGPVVPHVENTILGNDNKSHFQLGGFDIGLEMTLKATFFKHVYLEFCQKGVYANYFGLRIYEGTARQQFFAYEVIANLGFITKF